MRKVKSVSLEPFNAARHQALLKAWLSKPHVRRWWGDPDEQLEQLLSSSTGCHQSIIIADEIPVGYIQWEQPSREELDAAGLGEIPEQALDIDIAIGDINYVGCGVGPRAIALVIEMESSNRSIPMIMMATSTENTVAQRAFEKAGFRRIREFDDPECGQMYLYIYGNNEYTA